MLANCLVYNDSRQRLQFFLLKYIKTVVLFHQIYCILLNTIRTPAVPFQVSICSFVSCSLMSNYYSVTKQEAKLEKKKKDTELEFIIRT